MTNFYRKFPLLLVALASSLFGQEDTVFIGGAWTGNVTPTSATVSVRLQSSGQRVRLQVGKDESLAPAVFSAASTTAAATGNTVKLNVQGLVPDTGYFFGLEVGGVLRTEVVSRGRFHTFPFGQNSFRIAFASCGDFRAPDQRAFAAILAEQPLLFIHTGDLHYSDTNSTVADDYRANYDAVTGHELEGALLRNVATAYMWDDHDFCGNDSDSTAVGRDTARASYRERVPHYPLAAAGGAVAQAFTVGRVRIIMTDLRSNASPASQRDAAAKTKLGAAQKAWFKQELINARDNGFPLIVWVCSVPWIGPATPGEDSWSGYATERTEIANFIRDNRVKNIALLSGDMHGLAFDDGTNSDYAAGGGAPLTVLHGASLTQGGSIKGGPYSGGVIPGSPQYGMLDVYDTGGPSVACRYRGMHATEGRRLTYIFSSASGNLRDHAFINISTLARLSTGSDSITSGFVLSGSTDRTVLVRAVGPTLASFGVDDALAQPLLAVYQGERLVAANAGWSGENRAMAGPLTDEFDRVGAFHLASEDSRDAALIVSLPPGNYTVQVRSGNSAPGAALLEVYDLP